MKRIDLSTFIALVVTIVWAASFIADIFISGYDPSPFIHLAMMTVVGAIFGKNFIVNQGNGNANKQIDESVNTPQPPIKPLTPATPENPVPPKP